MARRGGRIWVGIRFILPVALEVGGANLPCEHSFGQQMLKVPCEESHIMDFWYLVNWSIFKVGLMHPTNPKKKQRGRSSQKDKIKI